MSFTHQLDPAPLDLLDEFLAANHLGTGLRGLTLRRLVGREHHHLKRRRGVSPKFASRLETECHFTMKLEYKSAFGFFTSFSMAFGLNWCAMGTIVLNSSRYRSCKAS